MVETAAGEYELELRRFPVHFPDKVPRTQTIGL